jgi:hypothetical protein
VLLLWLLLLLLLLLWLLLWLLPLLLLLWLLLWLLPLWLLLWLLPLWLLLWLLRSHGGTHRGLEVRLLLALLILAEGGRARIERWRHLGDATHLERLHAQRCAAHRARQRLVARGGLLGRHRRLHSLE